MANINYELIGAFPEVDAQVDNLNALINKYKTVAYANKIDAAIDASLIEMIAAHVYGIDAKELGSMTEVIAAIEAAEQNLEFA
jgi:hypothetical protein